jgi:hypothetical protein
MPPKHVAATHVHVLSLQQLDLDMLTIHMTSSVRCAGMRRWLLTAAFDSSRLVRDCKSEACMNTSA